MEKELILGKMVETFSGDFSKGRLNGQGVIDYTSVINVQASGVNFESIRKLEFNIISPG